MSREARRNFRVNRLDLESINFTLALLADRMDELEGRRGTPKFKSNIDMGLNRVTQMKSGSSVTDGATVTQVDAVAADVDGLSGATGGVANLTASATPGASRLVMSPSGSQYIAIGWIDTSLFALFNDFESSEQTITLATDVTVAHGLGVVPKLFKAVIRCKTAQLGYAVGDEVEPLNLPSNADEQNMLGAYANATDVGYAVGNTGIRVTNRTTVGTLSSITLANWRLVFRAWA